MSVDFLTEEQERRYGRFAGEPTLEQLEKYFQLDFEARDFIAARAHGDENRLGLALQLGTVRFLGTFLPDPTDVPAGVVRYVASLLRIDPAYLSAYGVSETRWDHTARIRERFHYRDFTEPAAYFRLLRWLYARAWVASQSPSMLFDLATAWLVEHKILLPGASVLARVVAGVRDRASARLWRRLSGALSRGQRERLEALLAPAGEGERQTLLDRLRRSPTRSNAGALANALARMRQVREMGVHRLDLVGLPPGRVAALARFANAARAQAIERMPADRRGATLLAFAHTLARTACDDVLDMFDDFVATAFGGYPRPPGRRQADHPGTCDLRGGPGAEDRPPPSVHRRRELPPRDPHPAEPHRGAPRSRPRCLPRQRGELRQPYREGQEDQLGALGLVLNAIVLWNTRYMDAALRQLRADGVQVLEEDLEHLSPLVHAHINMLGRYHFTVPEAVLRGELRPLRDPNDPDEILNVGAASA